MFESLKMTSIFCEHELLITAQEVSAVGVASRVSRQDAVEQRSP